jgi:hypothetical protein
VLPDRAFAATIGVGRDWPDGAADLNSFSCLSFSRRPMSKFRLHLLLETLARRPLGLTDFSF